MCEQGNSGKNTTEVRMQKCVNMKCEKEKEHLGAIQEYYQSVQECNREG